MKSNFALAKEELCQIGIVRVVSDFYSMPKRKGSVFFVKSPTTHDQTASLALYPNSNRFCDFANGNYNGDIIGFVAYVQGCNNWQALKELQAYYGLTDSREQDRQEAQRRIQLQQEQERRRLERKNQFKSALSGCIKDLKEWENIYRTAVENRLFKPFSDEWCCCVNELQKTEYRLDILCATDCKTYPRLKSNAEKGVSSDHSQWLLDVLAVLAEGGVFTAAESELEEIRAQRNFELDRKPGKDRVCGIGW